MNYREISEKYPHAWQSLLDWLNLDESGTPYPDEYMFDEFGVFGKETGDIWIPFYHRILFDFFDNWEIYGSAVSAGVPTFPYFQAIVSSRWSHPYLRDCFGRVDAEENALERSFEILEQHLL